MEWTPNQRRHIEETLWEERRAVCPVDGSPLQTAGPVLGPNRRGWAAWCPSCDRKKETENAAELDAAGRRRWSDEEKWSLFRSAKAGEPMQCPACSAVVDVKLQGGDTPHRVTVQCPRCDESLFWPYDAGESRREG